MIGQLAAKFPGSLWDQIPKGCFNYGAGGVNGWANICGGANAGSALLAQLGAPTSVKDEYLRWYETNAFPSNDAYTDYASGNWAATGGWTGIVPANGAPRSKAGAILCHASWTKWYKAAGGTAGAWVQNNFTGTDQQKLDASASDRCGKLVYDCNVKLVQPINNWKNGILPSGATDPSATTAGCMNNSCHTQTSTAALPSRGKMQCTDSCHQ